MKVHKHNQRRVRVRVAVPLILLAIGWWYWLTGYVEADNQRQLAQAEQNVRDMKAHVLLIERITAERLRQEAAERKASYESLTSILISQISAGATTLPQSALELVCSHAHDHSDPSEPDVMVNKQHCIKPLTYQPPDLVSDSEVTLTRQAYDAYRAMKRAATNDRVSWTPTSSYRSYQTQILTYTEWYRSTGSPERANEFAALPGYSEHQLGLAVDFRVGGCALECFYETTAYRWLRTHAHEYGFIERYPVGKTGITGYGAEAWHWRYVGKDIAADMKKQGTATLEEYYQMPGGIH